MADKQILIDIKVEDKEIKEAVKRVDNLTDSIEELSNRVSTARKQNKEYQKEQKNLNEQYEKGQISTKEYEKEVDKLNAKIKTNNKVIAETSVELSKQKRERTANLNLIFKEGKSYDALSAKLNKSRKEAKDLAVQFGKNSKEFKAAAENVRKLDKQLKDIDNELGQNQRSVGKYSDALGKLKLGTIALKAAMVALIVKGFSKIGDFVRDGIKTFTDFVSVSSKVLAISGANASEFIKLNKLFKDLGATTKFTAMQVAEAAVELSKLGLNTQEILDSTEAILNLSAAFDDELAESAAVASGTLKGLDLEATEMTRVTDVMANSFSSTGLDLEKFGESAKDVVPFVAITKSSIEEMTAALGVLADNQISGTKAGTGLKQIFREIKEDGVPLAETLKSLQKEFEGVSSESEKLALAEEKVGKVAQAQLLILVKNADKVRDLKNQFDGAAGTASRLAKIMQDNLKGDLDAANSAMEGLQITIGEKMNPALRAATKAWTDTIRGLNKFLEVPVSKQLADQSSKVNTLTTILMDSNITADERNRIYDELTILAPKVLEGIDRENISTKQLTKNLAKFNAEMINKIILQRKSEELTKLQENAADAFEKSLEQRKNATEKVIEIEKLLLDRGKLTKENIEEIKASTTGAGKPFSDYAKEIQKAAAANNLMIKSGPLVTDSYTSAALSIGLNIAFLKKFEKETGKATKKSLDFAKELETLKSALNITPTENKEVINETEKTEEKITSITNKERKARANREKSDADKRIARIKKANEALLKIEQQRQIDGISDAEMRKNEKIKIENERRIKLLENENLLEKERELIIEKSKDKINDIEKEFAQKQERIEQDKKDRIKAANETISKITNERAVEELTTAEAQKNKLIELENVKLAILLENETLLKEERIALKLETEEKIKEIEEQFAEEKEEKGEENKELEKEKEIERREALIESLEELQSITSGFADEELAIFDKIKDGITEAYEDGTVNAKDALNALSTAASAVFETISNKRNASLDSDLNSLEANRQAELELVEGNEQAQLEINNRYDKEEQKLRLKKFKADKEAALIEIGIQTILAVSKSIAASPETLGLPFSAIVAAIGAAQIAVVASKQPPKSFGDGTSDIVSIGGSHSSGNDVTVVGYDKSGNSQLFGKVEKGEAMPVIRKSAVNDYKIAKLNGAFASESRKFAEGTADITSTNNTNIDIIDFQGAITDAIRDANINVKVEDITYSIGKKVEVVSNSKV